MINDLYLIIAPKTGLLSGLSTVPDNMIPSAIILIVSSGYFSVMECGLNNLRLQVGTYKVFINFNTIKISKG